MSQHDRWLANYHTSVAHVWCSNRFCDNHEDGIDVTYESEFGQGTFTPEDCPLCNHGWVEDKPEIEEDNDE